MKNKKLLTMGAIALVIFVVLIVGIIVPWIKDMQTPDEEQRYNICVSLCKDDISAKFSSIINMEKLNVTTITNCSSSSGGHGYGSWCSYNIPNTISLTYGSGYSTMQGHRYSFKLNISEPFKNKELFNDSFVSLFPECWDGKETGCKEKICEHIYSKQEKKCIESWSCNMSIDSSGREYLYAEFSHRTLC